MPLTRNFRETVLERARTDPEFRVGLLTEAAECLLNDDVEVAKALLRDYVNATLGFKELGVLTDKKPQSLMRMLSASGNPSIDIVSKIMAALRTHEGVNLQIKAGVSRAKTSPKRKSGHGQKSKSADSSYKSSPTRGQTSKPITSRSAAR